VEKENVPTKLEKQNEKSENKTKTTKQQTAKKKKKKKTGMMVENVLFVLAGREKILFFFEGWCFFFFFFFGDWIWRYFGVFGCVLRCTKKDVGRCVVRMFPTN